MTSLGVDLVSGMFQFYSLFPILFPCYLVIYYHFSRFHLVSFSHLDVFHFGCIISIYSNVPLSAKPGVNFC